MHLIRKEEGAGKFLAWIYNGKFYKQDSMEYSSDAKGTEIYAMDRYGNMITMPVSLDYKQNAAGRSYVGGEQPASPRAYGELAQHDHSSLNAGREVISAGVVRIQQGVITYIDNMSGHYKPTRR